MRHHYCEDCNEPITYRRIQANPKTRLCVVCQEDREKNGDFQLHRMDVLGKTRCGEIDAVESMLYRGG